MNKIIGLLKAFYEWSTSLIGTIVIVIFFMSFVLQSFLIPSGSMKNSLLVGDFLFVKKFAYGTPIPRLPWVEMKLLPDFNDNGHLIEGDKPQRGDIVVFRYPKNDKIHYVKRAVAIGGDIVMLKDKQLLLHPKEGDKYINEHYKDFKIISLFDKKWIVNPYKKDFNGIHNDNKVNLKNGKFPPQLFNMLPTKVPEGEYFMMGDNRDHSNDSRFWGTVPYKYVVGSPWFIWFSWDENYEIRWDRMFKFVDTIEKETKKSTENNHKTGIY